MNREERGPWYLLTALIIGVALGVAFAWLVAPVEYINTSPESLRDDYKDQFRSLVAAAYVFNGDLARARARLIVLNEEDLQAAVALQAERALAQGGADSEAYNLSLLSAALSQRPTPRPQLTSIPEEPGTLTPSPTLQLDPTITPSMTAPELDETEQASAPSPQAAALLTTAEPSPVTSPTPSVSAAVPSITALPTRTPTITPGAPFVLKQDVKLLCSTTRSIPLIIVEALDAAGSPVPGVQVLVQWQGGEDRFFTGLKPELGTGYADFEMTPSITYTVQLAEGGLPIPGLIASECETTAGERHWGAWHLIFVQP